MVGTLFRDLHRLTMCIEWDTNELEKEDKAMQYYLSESVCFLR